VSREGEPRQEGLVPWAVLASWTCFRATAADTPRELRVQNGGGEMSNGPSSRPFRLQRLCDSYVRNAATIGALYVVVPTLIWFGLCLALWPLRPVYILRLALAAVVGGAASAFLNRYGVDLWILKHRSRQGPATLLDGALIGAGVGFGCAFLPPLTNLISSTDLEFVKLFVLAVWAGGALVGGLNGLWLTAVGRAHFAREWPECGGPDLAVPSD